MRLIFSLYFLLLFLGVNLAVSSESNNYSGACTNKEGVRGFCKDPSKAHKKWYTLWYTLYTIRCTLYAIRVTLYTTMRVVLGMPAGATVHYTLYAIRCTLYTIHYTLYTA